MHLLKILSILGLLQSWTSAPPPCHSENQLEGAARRKLERDYPQPQEPPVTHGANECPSSMVSPLPDDPSIHNRSLSPWVYERIHNADYFPSSYVEARCLCSGCILIKDGRVSHSINYNSVAVKQSRIFLKREPCPGNNTYRLTPTPLDVAVACTCVRPRRHTSS